MQTQMKRDEHILKKAFEENDRLKKTANKRLYPTISPPKKKTSIAADVPNAEAIKDQFMDKLTS